MAIDNKQIIQLDYMNFVEELAITFDTPTHGKFNLSVVQIPQNDGSRDVSLSCYSCKKRDFVDLTYNNMDFVNSIGNIVNLLCHQAISNYTFEDILECLFSEHLEDNSSISSEDVCIYAEVIYLAKNEMNKKKTGHVLSKYERISILQSCINTVLTKFKDSCKDTIELESIFDFLSDSMETNEVAQFENEYTRTEKANLKEYAFISVTELGDVRPFIPMSKALLVKANPVENKQFGSRSYGLFASHEYADTIWLFFEDSCITNKKDQLVSLARMCETNRYVELDIENWFKSQTLPVDENGRRFFKKVYIALKHDEYFDEMDYYYQTHGNENLSEYEEEAYIQRQRELRAAGRPYDDYIDSFDENDDDDYIW